MGQTGAVPSFKVAIVGAGMIGRLHARAFQAVQATFGETPWRVELSVIADADDALTREARERWNIGRAVSSWQDVVEADDVDIAVVGLPNHDHRAAVEALVRAGKHVLCEKPLAPTVADARSMLEAARRAGVVHGIGFNLRRAPAIAAIRQAVAEGAVGTPRHFSGHFFTDYAVSTAVPFTWRYQRNLAGSGALGDVGSHILDLARYLMGDVGSVSGATLATFIHERPVPAAHVTGHNIGPTTGKTGTVDTDDSGAFTCRFASGAIGDIRFSRVAPGHRGPAFDLIGSHGAISFDMTRAGEFTICSEPAGDHAASGFRRVDADPRYPYGSEVVAPIGFDYADTYVAQAYEFLCAVAQQRSYEPGFEDGVAIAAICEAVQHLAERGQALAPERVEA